MLSRVQDSLSRVTAVQAAAACSVAVGACSFMVSYSDLSGLAEKFSTAHPWSIPLVVDGLVIGATIAAAAFRAGGRKAYAWALLSFGALLSIAGNGLAAWYNSGSPIGVSISAVPPLVLLLITHLTMMLWSESNEKAEQPAAKEAAPVVEETTPALIETSARTDVDRTTELLPVEVLEGASAA
ncbi:DUF2637 domain-containing protein [Nocardia sp. CA-128927]|uniref:DUF2637 domain-containing protein n=1 Tax=Nocardia sp. CA-128927 TaxID=3239975 RepID=UPI003D97BAF8